MTALRHILMIVMLISAVIAGAQRRVTPIASPGSKPAAAADTTETKPDHLVETTDIYGHVVLVDTISGVEYRDTILTQAPSLEFPRWQAVSVGVNVWDPVMRLCGQDYGLIGFWGEVSIHNWIKPYLEIGLGKASYTPDLGNYTYRSPAAPYFKLGVNYNFLYNSNPDYSVYAFLRYGFSNFSFDVTDVSVSDGYWGETINMSVPSQRVTAGYVETGLGLRVMLNSHIALGWEVKVHAMTNCSNAQYGKPWYIPGYGARGSLFTGAISVSYTLPLQKPKPKAAPEADADE